jgi:predicted nuclease of restriction endonuclease-like RecB superfamily
MTQRDDGHDYRDSKNKAQAYERKQKDKIIKNLTYLLADMCRQADEDCPSEYRTKHFRSKIAECYDYLYEIGYLKEKNVCSHNLDGTLKEEIDE